MQITHQSLSQGFVRGGGGGGGSNHEKGLRYDIRRYGKVAN